MGAAIVLGDDLDILMAVVPVQLVLDPKVGKMDAVVEVRQVVFMRPAFDFARIAIGPSIAIRSATISFLEPLLIFALERVVEDDSTDFRALIAQPFFLSKVGVIELGVVCQLTRPAHAGVEGLAACVVVIQAVGLQEVVAAFG